MNIVVKTASGSVYCRPDTTWERENKDLFVPDGVEGYTFAPVLFVRVSKAGKCIGEKFADRYYDSFNYGALLYIGEDIATGSCFDHTSILPSPLYNKVVLEKADNAFEMKKGGKVLFRCEVSDQAPTIIAKALAEVSGKVSLRIGDYVAIELAERTELASQPEEKANLSGTFCGNPLFDFNIVF